MPVSDWLQIQQRAGRNLIGLDDTTLAGSKLYAAFSTELRDKLRGRLDKLDLPADVELSDPAVMEGLAALGPLLLANPQITDEQIVSALRSWYFDAVAAGLHVSREFTSSWTDRSRIGADDKPLVLKFRKDRVTADQDWVAYLRQQGENPDTVEWRFRWKIDATYQDGSLQGTAEYYHEGGIRRLQYPEWPNGTTVRSAARGMTRAR